MWHSKGHICDHPTDQFKSRISIIFEVCVIESSVAVTAELMVSFICSSCSLGSSAFRCDDNRVESSNGN